MQVGRRSSLADCVDAVLRVFAAANFGAALATGWVHTDDEDDGNTNTLLDGLGFHLSDATEAAIAPIMTTGVNTTLGLALVHVDRADRGRLDPDRVTN
jgi:hypothetical protein